MPRLHHTKARTGCQQCKRRKVKCDEVRPKCSACKRHDVQCNYLITVVPKLSSNSGPSQIAKPDRQTCNIKDHASLEEDSEFTPDPILELRLMHEWATQVPQSFSTAWEFWAFQAPLIAFEHRYVLDSLLCLAALHASRRQAQQWLALEGRMAPSAETEPKASAADSMRGDARKQGSWTLPNELEDSERHDVRSRVRMDHLALQQQRSGMLGVARAYFYRALAGQNKALPAIDAESGEACYLASICVSWAALFCLGEDQDDEHGWLDDPIQWVRIAHGSRVVISHWVSFAGWDWLKSSGIFYGQPDMNDQASLFARHHAALFEKLRTWAADHEAQSCEDAEAYTKTVSYIGVMYKCIRDGSDCPNATARRIMAMSSIVPDRWTELVEERRPRAIAILMHAFACAELIAKENFWFRGIAKKQIPRLCECLPTAWSHMIAWPLRVAQGDVNSVPLETAVEIDELGSL